MGLDVDLLSFFSISDQRPLTENADARLTDTT